MMTGRKIASHLTYLSRKLLPNKLLTLADDGTVLAVEECAEPDRVAGAEFYSGILVPGFVNSHCHLELSYMQDMIPPGGGYLGFAKGISEKRGDFTPDGRRRAAAAADAAMWQQGISAVADICNGQSTFDIKTGSRMAYHSFLEFFGLGPDMDIETHLLDTARAASEAGLRFSTTPHSTYSIGDEPFRQAVEGFTWRNMSGEQPLLSVHFLESPQEAEIFRREGDMWQWYAGRGISPEFIGRYGSPAERLTALVPPERDILLVHNCCITEEDYDRVVAHFTGKVTWVLCPRSNEYISGLTPPAGLLRRKGAKIAVGTDSLASNRSLDIVEELKQFCGIPLEELLSWATVNGAEALGTGGTLGTFSPGTKPGGTLITGIDWQTMSLAQESRSGRIF